MCVGAPVLPRPRCGLHRPLSFLQLNLIRSPRSCYSLCIICLAREWLEAHSTPPPPPQQATNAFACCSILPACPNIIREIPSLLISLPFSRYFWFGLCPW
ncbi:hypothetical protein BDZ91DRAFT_78880 [Kalaharituber pfeilii]|nr:hypothetical protein BDZ91DRAFT_78880 [Kalaharituber pfeilii]